MFRLGWAVVLFILSFVNIALADFDPDFNPILVPRDDEVVRPGSNFLVEWTPTTTGLVSLFVRAFGGTTGNVIADSINATTGHYLWAVPASLAANTSAGTIDPFNFELRIYQGSLGLSTMDVEPFSDTRIYSFSSGYFAITNDRSFTTLGPFTLPTTTQDLPFAAATFSDSITITDSDTTATGTATTTATSTTKKTAGVATRTPTFLAISSEGRRTVQSVRPVMIGAIVGCTILGVMAL
jgi:hypothetical protein